MNPELQRNLWLEFSVHRLIAMPCVLALNSVRHNSCLGAREPHIR